MLLENRNRIEPSCPRWCSLLALGGLLPLAVILAGINLQAAAATNLIAPGTPAAAAQDDPPDQDKSDDPPTPSPAPAALPAPPVAPPAAPAGVGVAAAPTPAAIAGLPPVPPGPLQPTPAANPLQPQAATVGAQAGRGFGAGFSSGHPYYQFDVFGGATHTRLGIAVGKPSPALSDQLDLPKGQGVVVEQVMPDSAAAKAGFKAHDILLEVNGKKVSNDPQALSRMVKKIEADTKFDALVLRKGQKETIKGIKLPEQEEGSESNPFGFSVAPDFGRGLPGGHGGLAHGQFLTTPVPAMPGDGGMAGYVASTSGHTVITTTVRNDDHFTTRCQEGSLIITLTGKVADGEAKVSKIHVQDGRESKSYTSADKVPEEYRDKVKNLLEMSEHGNAQVEIRGSANKKPTKKKPKTSSEEEDAEPNDGN